MGLEEYKKKRNFKSTPEPLPKLKKAKEKKLRFVIQEHHARRLHYDLRLEVNGVLKSWAIPKGPSLDPSEKRLAMMVEDHPYEYQYFEGVIPEGYGAGNVIIWDKGTYNVKGLPPKESEKLMNEGLEKGEIHFTLEGERLKGEFLLIHMKGRGKGNEWLLIKKKDEYVEADQSQELDVTDDVKVELSNVEKIFWPKEKITKADLIEYYIKISSYIIPHLKDHPQSLNRYPDGIEGSHFFQKNLESHPNWIQTVVLEHDHKDVEYLLIQDVESLVFAVNLGCIELNPFLSKVDTLEYPDFFVIDLDPEDISFSYVVEVALEIHQVMEELAIPHYCKTSGATGLHICTPLAAKYTYAEARNFALLIANIVHSRMPKITSLERKPAKRQKKIYLDCFQNALHQTIAAPYCVRARPGAPVSTPLEWSEVKKGIDPSDFTIFQIEDRLKKKGDIFKPVIGKGIKIEKFLPKIEALLKASE